MRRHAMLAACAALIMLSANEARAYDGPWCAVYSIGRGSVREDCSMPSFEVCRREALSFGSTSFCRQNGYFRGYSSENARYRAKKSKRSRQYRSAQ
jgi:hypothetical protein